MNGDIQIEWWICANLSADKQLNNAIFTLKTAFLILISQMNKNQDIDQNLSNIIKSQSVNRTLNVSLISIFYKYIIFN